MKLRHEPIPLEKFVWDRTTRTFTAEASELRGFKFLNQLYDDACDVGFTLQSRQEVTYVLEQEHRQPASAELGDITHWTFVPTRESYNSIRECVNTKVVIFND